MAMNLKTVLLPPNPHFLLEIKIHMLIENLRTLLGASNLQLRETMFCIKKKLDKKCKIKITKTNGKERKSAASNIVIQWEVNKAGNRT